MGHTHLHPTYTGSHYFLRPTGRFGPRRVRALVRVR